MQYFAAALAIGLAAFGGALAMGYMVAKMLESTARQPESAKLNRPLFFVGLAFIEAAVLYGLVVAIMLMGK
jgi:F-type H+-transporting ATPase subunit c